MKSNPVISPPAVDMSPFSSARVESVQWEKSPSICCNKIQRGQDEVNFILCREPGHVVVKIQSRLWMKDQQTEYWQLATKTGPQNQHVPIALELCYEFFPKHFLLVHNKIYTHSLSS